MYQIGIIGCGGRMSGVYPHLIKNHPDMRIAAVADPRTADMAEKFAGQDVHIYADADSMLANESLDGVMIGTRCSLHTPMALLAGNAGIPLFLEKPVAISWDQLSALESLMPMSDKIVVSFPLRRSAIVERVKEYIDGGTLGTIQHVQAWNNVNYGRGYYHKWYRDDNETGGLFLQKTTHDFDYLNYLLGDNAPVQICAMESKQIFKGDMPAGQKCADCPKAAECPEHPEKVRTYGSGSGNGQGEWCCFAVDTGNHDSASAIVAYENGLHLNYSQNFFVRKDIGRRGARFMGYYGTVEFEFNTATLRVVYHNRDEIITENVGAKGGHAGGDALLMNNFADIVRGKDVSKSTLAQGILSARMCLAARESAETKQFIAL